MPYRNLPLGVVPSARIQLPVGTMAESTRSVRVVLAHNARTRALVQAVVERLDGSAAEYFFIPTTIDDGEELALEYSLEGVETMRFTEALATFAAAPAIHLPELVEMARYLEVAVEYLERVDVPAVIAPACLRYAPNRHAGRGSWRLLVVPLVDVALADWARSAPEAWQWTPSPVLFGKAQSPGAYAIGAALCAALAGDVFPPFAATGDRLRRALRGWVGSRSRLDDAVRGALPDSFADERGELVALVLALLEPAPPDDWRARLECCGEQLAPYRTAVRWEFEGKIDIARGILERMVASRPREHVPWDVVARVRGREHDLEGALDAAISALGDGGDAVRELAAITRRVAHGGDGASRMMIERAVAAIDRLGPRLGDLGRLYFAHIEARYLDRLTQAEARLAAAMAAPWDNVLRATQLARIHAARSEWARVAVLCKQAKVAVCAMPDSGGGLGRYIVAYLDHLDGVAHCGAAPQYADPAYLADAFARFVASLDAARSTCEPDDPLIRGNVHWLHRMAAIADEMQVADAAIIRTGVLAWLSANGIVSEIRHEPPAIVWYDAGRLLALSGAP